MNLSATEIDILFDAVRGYTVLWNAKWECSRQEESLLEASYWDDKWIRQGKVAVQKLLEHSLIFLHWDDQGDIPGDTFLQQDSNWDNQTGNCYDQPNPPSEIPLEQALELLQDDKYWSPSKEENALFFSAMDKGKEALRTNEQIKAYYQSEEFAFRYPAPEWHPMKRS